MGISLSYERYEEIKQIVVDLFVKYDICCVPVNGFELATKMDIKVIPYSAVPGHKRWLLFKKSEDGFSVEKDIPCCRKCYPDSVFGTVPETGL